MSVIPVPNEAMKAKILNTLDLSENRINDNITILRQWINMQPHLPRNISDEILKSFIYGSKGIEIAKEKLDRYFTVRNAFPVVFADRDPTKFTDKTSIQMFLLPYHTKEGYNVFVLRMNPDASPTDFDHLQVVKRQMLITDYIISKGMETAGFVALYDVAKASAQHMTRFNISYNTIAVKCYQDNYPMRIKKVILVNTPSIVVKTFENLIKPLMKPKFAQKIVIIGPDDKKTLLDHLPEEAVPKDLGGTGPECADLNRKFLDTLENEKDWCLMTQNQKIDETKRTSKTKYDFEQNFGVEGTFRKLTLD